MAKQPTSAFVELFGSTLLGSDKKEASTESILQGKDAVFVYFSAHWCPPCRRFTPMLAELYKKHAKTKNFEIVFVSSDKEQSGFDEYFGEMPWTALPFAERTAKAKLSQKFGVRGIPMLVILGPDGSLITKDGREAVSSDEEFENFPWTPKSFQELLGDSFLNQKMEKVGKEAIEGKTLGLYFSAHWCPPCRMFTPQLASFYTEYKKLDPNFEIIFVSSDQDEDSFRSYFTTDHGDWLALPFERRSDKDSLSSRFEVEGIPTFIVVDQNGAVINASARSLIGLGAAQVAQKGWEPPVLGDLAQGAEAAGQDINGCAALVALVEGCDDAQQDDTKKVLTPIAEKYVAEAKASGDSPKYIFFVACEESQISQRIRELTKQTKPSDTPTLLLLDIPDQGGYYVRAVDDVTEEAVNKFLSDHASGSIKGERKQLGD